MDFQLSEDQKALQDGIRSFCRGSVPAERLPELEKLGGVDRALWSELAELGVFSLRLPESKGGVGLGFADAVVVFAELGRRLVPGPLIFSQLAADLIEGAATGQRIVGGIDVAAHGPLVIEHLAGLDVLLVLGADGVYQLDPKRLRATPIETPLDPLTPIHQLASLPGGTKLGDAALAARLRREGAVLSSALLLGIAEETVELARAYALQREQFGRPIGGFQAIKHILADMFVRQEVARAAAYAAGCVLDDPAAGDAAIAVASAKVNCGESAMKNSRACIQVHGGMGFTWEIPAHYYLKRCWVLENSFGTVEEHCDQLAAGLASA
jgi:alkylation response protein AidB-like acyl-CoA dehydrogenase